MARATAGVQDALTRFADFAWFCWTTFRGTRFTLQRYYKEVLRQLADISWGSGALLVGGGTVGVMVLLSLSAGTSLGIEGFNGLEIMGLAPLTGFVSAGSTPVSWPPWSPLSPSVARWVAGSRRRSARCGSRRRSMRSR
ncbi:MAG TPA: hypothetical protein VIR30_15585 [Nocardioides sp.]